MKELERDQLILRKEYPQIPPKVEYSLSERGKSLMKISTNSVYGERKTGFESLSGNVAKIFLNRSQSCLCEEKGYNFRPYPQLLGLKIRLPLDL